jgi:hypothetical protein
LDRFEVEKISEVVERGEEPVEEPDDLASVEAAREGREVDDVGEQDARLLEVVGDGRRVRLQALRDLLWEHVQQQILDARLCLRAPLREGHEQEHCDQRDRDDVHHVERRDERTGQLGCVRPHDLGEAQREHDREDEGPEPRPGAARTVERDGAQRGEEGPQDHRARRVETAHRHDSQRGCDEDQEQLNRPQEGEVPGSGEHDEAEDRAGHVAPRRQRYRGLADEPVREAPEEAGGEDQQGDPDEQALAEAQIARVGRVAADVERPVDEVPQRRGHRARA